MEFYKDKMKTRVQESKFRYEKTQSKYTSLINTIVVGVASTIFVAVAIYQIFIK